MRIRIQKIIVATAAIYAALAASGCLVNRVVEVRGQVCAFEEHFDIDLAGSASVAFREPVLLERDVYWLAGASPTHEFPSDNGFTMVYEVEKVGAAPGTAPEFWLALDFLQVDGTQRLERLRVDPALVALLGPELPDHAALATAAREACDHAPGLLSRTINLSITEEELELLPSRDELLSWLGEPLKLDAKTGRIEYAYRLKSPDDAPPTARMAIWYDAKGIRPLRMESEFSRFHSEADFETRTLTMNVEW